MRIEIFADKLEMGEAAAVHAARSIDKAIRQRGVAYVIAATGASQFEFLDALVQKPIDWSRVTFFHLDEYVGLTDTHPASFRKYLRERIQRRVQPADFHFIEGDGVDPEAECRRLGQLISKCTIDVAFVGIGENGHLAFNDPPADFETDEPFIVVELDEACRRQQLGEGWFASLGKVPKRAISMTIREILRARKILCIVPDERKANAVKRCLEEEISPQYPASALRKHPDTILLLDEAAASLVSRSALESAGQVRQRREP